MTICHMLLGPVNIPYDDIIISFKEDRQIKILLQSDCK